MGYTPEDSRNRTCSLTSQHGYSKKTQNGREYMLVFDAFGDVPTTTFEERPYIEKKYIDNSETSI